MESMLAGLLIVLGIVWFVTAFKKREGAVKVWKKIILYTVYPAFVGAALVFWLQYAVHQGLHLPRSDPRAWLGLFIIVLFVASHYLLEGDYAKLSAKVDRCRPVWRVVAVDTLEAAGMLLGLYILGFLQSPPYSPCPRFLGWNGFVCYHVLILFLMVVWQIDRWYEIKRIIVAVRNEEWRHLVWIGPHVMRGATLVGVPIFGLWLRDDINAALFLWGILLSYLIWEQFRPEGELPRVEGCWGLWPLSTTVFQNQGDEMELKKFIGAAISEIIEGVSEAQMTEGNMVNPRHVPTKQEMAVVNGTLVGAGPDKIDMSRVTTPVEFDIAVTVSEATEASGGIKLHVFGGSLGHESSSALVNRVKFSVPVVLPT